MSISMRRNNDWLDCKLLINNRLFGVSAERSERKGLGWFRGVGRSVFRGCFFTKVGGMKKRVFLFA